MTIAIALKVAIDAHAGQVDKAGRPYIEHLVRVAFEVFHFMNADLVAAALLHDVLEDTDLQWSDLSAKGVSMRVIHIVVAITRMPDEEYFDYIHRVCETPEAAMVKRADLKDHLHHNTESITESLKQRYEKALREIFCLTCPI